MNQIIKKRKIDSEPTEYSEIMSMELMPDVILLKIFLHLTSIEKIRIEGVCKRWRVLVNKAWNNYDFLSFYGSESRKNPLVEDKINKRIILKTIKPKIYRKVFSMSGANLLFLSLSDKIDVFNAGVLSTIAEFCQNLTHLRINHIHDPYAAGLNQLLCVNKNLSLFTINDFGNYEQLARCLRHLPTQSLKELKIRSTENQTNIEAYIQNLNSLLNKTSLTSLNIETGDDETIKTIGEHQELRLLSLRRFKSESDISFLHIAKLRNLVHLDLSYCRNYVDDKVLINLEKNSKNLKILDVNECNRITMNGLKALCSMIKLKTIQLAGIEAVDDFILDIIPNSVSTLGLALSSITDDGIQPFIRRHENLIDLDIRFCATTNETLQVAVETTKYRTNNKILTIAYTYNPVLDISPFQGESPLLKLVSSIE